MLLVLQFPLGDLRSFASQDERLPSPYWPQPLDGQYLRSAGQIRRRNLGGLNNWIGESQVCAAKRAARFSGDRKDFRIDQDTALEPCFRRFFFDGYLSGKFEFGFRIRNSGTWPKNGVHDLRILLGRMFSHPVRIAGSGGVKTVPLINAGKDLAQLYCRASTPRASASQGRGNAHLVQAGAPMLFIETEADEVVINPFHVKNIAGLDEAEATLSHFWVRDKNLATKEVRCWLMRGKRRSDYARELRISLLRLNASRVGLESLLDALLRKVVSPAPHSAESERLQLYLNDVVDRYVQVPAGFKESSLLAIACQTENDVLANGAGLLIGMLKTEVKIRRQVLGKTERTLASLTTLIQSEGFSSERFNIIMGDQIGGDKYEAGQVVTQGREARTDVQTVTFNQVWQQNKGEVDLATLGAELETLRARLGQAASAPEHYIEIGAIASAEVEAKKGNGEKVYEALSKAGKWSLGVAEKIGVGVAIAALKTSLGV
jgi:hypothetical protein